MLPPSSPGRWPYKWPCRWHLHIGTLQQLSKDEYVAVLQGLTDQGLQRDEVHQVKTVKSIWTNDWLWTLWFINDG